MPFALWWNVQRASCAHDAVVNHFRDGIADVIPDFGDLSSCGGVVLTERLRPHVDPDMVRELVKKRELQDLLKVKDYQSLSCGLVRMNKSGRNYFLQDPGDKVKGVRVLGVRDRQSRLLVSTFCAKTRWHFVNPLAMMTRFLCIREEKSLALCNRQWAVPTTTKDGGLVGGALRESMRIEI
jgi:hypothetical protein